MTDELHLEQGLVDGHRAGRVHLLAQDQRAVALHLDRDQAALGVGLVPVGAGGGLAGPPRPGGLSCFAPASTPGARTETVSLTLRRSAARRRRDSSLAKARSSAAYLSSAAASALIAGPRDRTVRSTRSRRAEWR